MELWRKYGAAASLSFPLIDAGANDFESTPVTFVDGDCQISKDGGAFTDTACYPWHVGNGVYAASLSTTEMQAKRIVLTVIDSATKAWEDQAVVISTYGASEALYDVNVVADYTIRRSFQNACDSSDGDTKTGRSLLGAVAKLVNKISISDTTLTVYEDDDSTSLFTQTVGTTAGASPITSLDTA